MTFVLERPDGVRNCDAVRWHGGLHAALALVIALTLVPAFAVGAGNVTVSVQNGALKIIGDEADNGILVTSDFNEDPADFVTVFGTGGTTVNGAPSVVAQNVTKNVTIMLKDGADECSIGETLDFPKNLVVDLGTGNDVLDFTDTRAPFGSIKIDGGDGDDVMSSSVLTAGRSLSISLGNGNDGCLVSDLLSAGGRASIVTGDGDDDVSISAELDAKLAVRTGRNADEVVVESSTSSQKLDFNLGDDDDTLTMSDTTFDGAVKANGDGGTNTLNDTGNTFNAGLVTSNF